MGWVGFRSLFGRTHQHPNINPCRKDLLRNDVWYIPIGRRTEYGIAVVISIGYHIRGIIIIIISLTLSRHFSLSFIASGRPSGLHPVFSHSCCMYVRAGRPAFARPYVGVHRSISLMSSSLLLQQCPACVVRLTWIVFVMGGRWSYSRCLVHYCSQHSCVIAV